MAFQEDHRRCVEAQKNACEEIGRRAHEMGAPTAPMIKALFAGSTTDVLILRLLASNMHAGVQSSFFLGDGNEAPRDSRGYAFGKVKRKGADLEDLLI